ncbi:MAG: hypothetical protein HYW05_02830 [Candidatus Diapherotrites archaeon]|nr:hypothetical protein [Candidatus Diapherotrites archaeon]
MVVMFMGQTIIYWSGMLAGFLIAFAFLGCTCFAIRGLFAKSHRLFVYAAIISIIVHVLLAVLAYNFGVWI